MTNVWRVVLVVGLSVVSAAPTIAQDPSAGDVRRTFATRAALEAQAASAERAAADASAPEGREFHRGEAWLLRRRLEQGDFVVGDRVVLAVVGEPTLTDTFTVRAGLVLELSNLPPVSLAGVLRSELESHLTAELSKYLRQPDVTALPLVRVAVMGPVARPGYYYVPADMLLTDLLMTAGGPGTNADLERSNIRRGQSDLYSSRDVRIALADGMSLDALSLRSGDELHLEERRRRNWSSILQAVGAASGLITLIVTLGN